MLVYSDSELLIPYTPGPVCFFFVKHYLSHTEIKAFVSASAVHKNKLCWEVDDHELNFCPYI